MELRGRTFFKLQAALADLGSDTQPSASKQLLFQLSCTCGQSKESSQTPILYKCHTDERPKLMTVNNLSLHNSQRLQTNQNDLSVQTTRLKQGTGKAENSQLPFPGLFHLLQLMTSCRILPQTVSANNSLTTPTLQFNI